MSVRHRKTQREMPQMPGVSPDQKIRRRRKSLILPMASWVLMKLARQQRPRPRTATCR